MLTARCPGCGRPAPLSLARPGQLRCPACGYDGPPPPEVREQLAQAAALLSQVELGRRQLSRSQRRALTSAWAGTVGYLLSFGVLLLPLAGCLACGVSAAREGEDTNWWMLTVCSAPTILLSLTGILGLLFIVERRRRLEEACAAIPPLHPGQAARCHVCGGDLAQEHGTDAIVRCDYCAADNLVHGRVSFDGYNRAGLDVGDRIRTVKSRACASPPVPRPTSPEHPLPPVREAPTTTRS